MTMDSLASNWRPHNEYPIILMDTKPWEHRDMRDIRRTWRTLDFKFVNIAAQFYSSPKNLTEAEFEDVKTGRPLSHIGYKQMCSFFTKGFTEVPLLMKYRYLLRLDDDTCLLDSINFDISKHMRSEGAAYAYTHVWKDDNRVVSGLVDFTERYMQARNLPYKNPTMHADMLGMKKLHRRVPSFNTNFEVINTVRYRDPELQNFLDAVVDTNAIFHRRWGDAPLRYMVAMMFWQESELMRLEGVEIQHSSWPVFPMTEHSDSNNPSKADFESSANAHKETLNKVK
jgi:hypothetical protein